MVKYGADVTWIEAETQIMICEKLQGRVPVPEVYGWEEDGNQGFLYMELVEGYTLMERWSGLSKDEMRAICEELNQMVKLMKGLEQDDGPYIGEFTRHTAPVYADLIVPYRQSKQTTPKRPLPHRPPKSKRPIPRPQRHRPIPRNLRTLDHR